MENPFKKDDAVLTKVKQRQVHATVMTVWKNEVQVKTADGDLLWRTMHTVWRAGEEPLKREPTPSAPAVPDKPTVPAVAVRKTTAKRLKAKAAGSKSQRRKRR